MNMNVYTSGSLVRSSAFFVNAAGAPADPTTTVFKYRPGTGAVQTVSPTRDGAGAFHFDMDTTGWAGPDIQTWTCQWAGTGAVQAIGDDNFGVKASSL
jgi:hypothetical protein